MVYELVTSGGSGGTQPAMEEIVKALEIKMAQLVTKTGSAASTSSCSSIASDNLPLPIKPESWLAWLRKFKSIATLNKWNPELQCQILQAYLEGLAEQTYYSLTAKQTVTCPDRSFLSQGISSSTHFCCVSFQIA